MGFARGVTGTALPRRRGARCAQRGGERHKLGSGPFALLGRTLATPAHDCIQKHILRQFKHSQAIPGHLRSRTSSLAAAFATQRSRVWAPLPPLLCRDICLCTVEARTPRPSSADIVERRAGSLPTPDEPREQTLTRQICGEAAATGSETAAPRDASSQPRALTALGAANPRDMEGARVRRLARVCAADLVHCCRVPCPTAPAAELARRAPAAGGGASALVRYDQLKQAVRDIKAEARSAQAAKAADREVRMACACAGARVYPSRLAAGPSHPPNHPPPPTQRAPGHAATRAPRPPPHQARTAALHNAAADYEARLAAERTAAAALQARLKEALDRSARLRAAWEREKKALLSAADKLRGELDGAARAAAEAAEGASAARAADAAAWEARLAAEREERVSKDRFPASAKRPRPRGADLQHAPHLHRIPGTPHPPPPALAAVPPSRDSRRASRRRRDWRLWQMWRSGARERSRRSGRTPRRASRWRLPSGTTRERPMGGCQVALPWVNSRAAAAHRQRHHMCWAVL